MHLSRRPPAALVAVLVTLAAASLGQPAHADKPAPGDLVHGKSWLVVDVSTAKVLAAKNPHRRLRPASTLKTLTALTLLPRLDKSSTYKVQWEDAAAEGSAVGIVPGASYTVDELFYGLLLPSGNDAAHALASAAGGMKDTVALMQEQAERVGAVDTTVRNSSGLDAPGQFTTAYDLALIAKSALRRRDFVHYATTATTAFPGRMPKRGGKRATYQIYNQNPLVLDSYRGVLGVKTGYTTGAGRTFVGAAERDGHLLIIVMMGYLEPTELAAPRLLDWGFAHVADEPLGYLVPAPSPERHLVARTPAPAVTPTTAGASLPGWGGTLVLAGVAVSLVVAVAGGLALRRGRG